MASFVTPRVLLRGRKWQKPCRIGIHRACHGLPSLAMTLLAEQVLILEEQTKHVLLYRHELRDDQPNPIQSQVSDKSQASD
jgi:hypothetical protein